MIKSKIFKNGVELTRGQLSERLGQSLIFLANVHLEAGKDGGSGEVAGWLHNGKGWDHWVFWRETLEMMIDAAAIERSSSQATPRSAPPRL